MDNPSENISASCIICEDFRPEPNNKLTLLGFFGLTPNVNIVFIDKNNLALRQLIFIITLKSHIFKKNGKLGFAIIDDVGKDVIRLEDFTTQPLEDLAFKNVVFGLGPIRFPKIGKYDFFYFLNKQILYQSSFSVSIDKSLTQ